MRVIIAGGRDFNNYHILEKMCDYYIGKRENIEIISGKARGTDSLGEKYAKERATTVKEFPADWDRYNKAAGHIRNKQMAEYASEDNGCLIAFWDGKSRGTKNMIENAKKYNLKIRVVRYD